MRMIYSIASREFKSLFLSPSAWSILAIMQFILAYLFLSDVEAFNSLQTKLANIDNAPGLTELVIVPLFGNTSILLLLITPLLTMRLICQERRNKTLALLQSAPVANYEIILGKYFAVLSFLLVMTAIISLMPLSLRAGGHLDYGKLLANGLAVTLLVSSYTAIGLYMSCIASHPTVAAISSFGVLLLLWVMELTSNLQQAGSELFTYLSMLNHFQNLQSGLVNSADIFYFLLFTAAFLVLSIRRLDYDRLQK